MNCPHCGNAISIKIETAKVRKPQTIAMQKPLSWPSSWCTTLELAQKSGLETTTVALSALGARLRRDGHPRVNVKIGGEKRRYWGRDPDVVASPEVIRDLVAS
jgi:hypothetical protein